MSRTKPRRSSCWLFAAGVIAATNAPVLAGPSVAVTPGAEFAAARQPQVAFGPDGAIHIAFGVGDVIYCSTSTDGGRTFAPPVKVGRSGVLALGKRRGPRIAATPSHVVITAPCGKLGGGKDGNTLAWRSADGGRSFTGPVRVNDAPDTAREGLHDFVANMTGVVFCVWVDLRNGRPQLFGAQSADGGGTWGENHLVYEGPICPCCQPSAGFSRDGTLHVLWRNNRADDRDMYLIDSLDTGRTWEKPRKVGQGTWHLRACPMDGGGFACDGAGAIHSIWRREKTIYQCIDGQPEVSLGVGEQGRAANGGDGVYFTWIAERPGALFLLTPKADRPLRLTERASDPAIAASVDAKGPVVVVWEEPNAKGGPIRAQTINP